MSYFPNKIVYILVPKKDITEEMINEIKKHYSSTKATLRPFNERKHLLFKLKPPLNPVFNKYEWKNCKEIKKIIEKEDTKDQKKSFWKFWR